MLIDGKGWLTQLFVQTLRFGREHLHKNSGIVFVCFITCKTWDVGFNDFVVVRCFRIQMSGEPFVFLEPFCVVYRKNKGLGLAAQKLLDIDVGEIS